MSGEIDVFNRLVASRYINGGLLAVLLWDHLTTLDREVELIWKSRGRLKWMLRGAFFLTRYGSEAYLLLNAFVQSGIHIPSADLYADSDAFCSTIALEISQFIFLLRAYALTNKRRMNLYMLTAGFLIASTISQASAIATVIALTKRTIYVLPTIHVCAVIDNPRSIIGVTAPGCAFDIFIIILTAYNGLAEPYQRNAEAFHGLYKDGAKLFLGNAALHFAILMAEIFAPTDIFLLMLIMSWALGAIMISRLHFKMESFVNLQNSLSFFRHSDESPFYL